MHFGYDIWNPLLFVIIEKNIHSELFGYSVKIRLKWLFYLNYILVNSAFHSFLERKFKYQITIHTFLEIWLQFYQPYLSIQFYQVTLLH